MGTNNQSGAASSGNKPPLQKRSVVSSFLYKFSQENGEPRAKVALFKRSGQVRTYPHRWAVVSGSIDPEDPSPLAAAWREIREETTLTSSSLELMRQGKSYVLPDESIGREWTIHPFAFRLKDPSEGGRGENGITLDWEHEDWAWYDPMDIEDSESFGAVPRLAESLRRVWFEKDLGVDAGAVLTNGLERLKNDHQSGARQLAGAALEILRDIILKMDAQQSTDEWWTKVRFAAWHIWKNGRESMGAAILSALLAALKGMEETFQRAKQDGTWSGSSSIEWRAASIEELNRRIAAREDAASKVSVALVNFLREQFATQEASGRPVKMLTLSESSTISHALERVIADTGLQLDLRILESRPLFEGVSLASSLIRAAGAWSSQASASHDAEAQKDSRVPPISKLQVTLYTDASAALASEGVDIVLLGADRIAESGAVSNKTGSLPAVLSARHTSSKAKIVVLGETEKVAPSGAACAHVVEDNAPTQLYRAWLAGHNSERIQSAAAGTVSNSLGSENAVATQPGPGEPAAHVGIRNIVFEWVPPELIHVYITEQGVWEIGDIHALSETLATEEERLFRHI
ncbi:nagb/rpia/CoA transferase-like protein [Cryphonectria parasitica EP155]|uniref:Nagb/rpia/CoA transferase-like protein n=1 Tax=Cryphonectria parasitica (strain ATCC 38755 / EP155) TaxID=660469 RepID=A0A9P4XUA4_CRYP1|nr:nagb/rpia/CoA transferase-like protein [Cryphonectria parasitica EP155]KAF3761422.1 nagb/rpia/CoA transferase-like protein [Cryphonectria parasitica EP155]